MKDSEKELLLCVDDLRIDRGQLITTLQAIIVNNKNRDVGDIDIQFFGSCFANNGTYICADGDSLKGFNIQYSKFHPNDSEFNYNEENRKLNVISNDVNFTLQFK
ncbi:hypothetical protein HWV03_12355 [Moritella sp. 36]|uniref:hypothetical protein n=1 Tax=Moritella sp. 36 TaxID=2746233 RepID=UPI001BA67D0A|nr:hypothetical protein [Moritella sp. 36]QUM89535.1 hypothetical protein HWV03_12355 [Moritella sp. 36]